jgi:hypothetical protein
LPNAIRPIGQCRNKGVVDKPWTALGRQPEADNQKAGCPPVATQAAHSLPTTGFLNYNNKLYYTTKSLDNGVRF